MATEADTCRKFVVPKPKKLHAKPAGWNSDPHSIAEQQAHQQIDAKLGASDWIVQDYNDFSPSVRCGVPLPTLAEQTKTVAEVERRLSVVEELESVVSASVALSLRLRQSIPQKAFSGEL